MGRVGLRKKLATKILDIAKYPNHNNNKSSAVNIDKFGGRVT